MTHKIRFADGGDGSEPGFVARGLRAVITLGVWILVALAGLMVWARLAA